MFCVICVHVMKSITNPIKIIQKFILKIILKGILKIILKFIQKNIPKIISKWRKGPDDTSSRKSHEVCIKPVTWFSLLIAIIGAFSCSLT